MKSMKIYLLDCFEEKTAALKPFFQNEDNVEIVTDEFEHFMRLGKADGVVSPANAFGLMDGGYDAAITAYFGNELQQKVQKKIIEEYGGHQTLGTALTVEATPDCKLIHVPTMCVPSKIKDPFLIYECMRSTLFEAKRHGIQRLVIPLFGGSTGQVESTVIAKMMWLGYRHFLNPNTEIDWATVYNIANEFASLGVPIE